MVDIYLYNTPIYIIQLKKKEKQTKLPKNCPSSTFFLISQLTASLLLKEVIIKINSNQNKRGHKIFIREKLLLFKEVEENKTNTKKM